MAVNCWLTIVEMPLAYRPEMPTASMIALLGGFAVNVKVVLDMGEPIVIEVRDVRNGLDVRGYLEQTTLERLAQDWMIENDSEAEVCF